MQGLGVGNEGIFRLGVVVVIGLVVWVVMIVRCGAVFGVGGIREHVGLVGRYGWMWVWIDGGRKEEGCFEIKTFVRLTVRVVPCREVNTITSVNQLDRRIARSRCCYCRPRRRRRRWWCCWWGEGKMRTRL